MIIGDLCVLNSYTTLEKANLEIWLGEEGVAAATVIA